MASRTFGSGGRVAVTMGLTACLTAGTAGGAGAVAAAVSTDPVEGYVERVYEDLLGRAVEPQGLAAWAGAVRAGVPRAAVANGITGSDEFRTRLIDDAYDRYLDRDPDPAGLAGWLEAMRRGATIQQLESGFLASDEYVAAAGGGWVQAMYGDVLGRTAGPSEVEAWESAISAGKTGRQQVALGILLSEEHLTTVVDAQYQDLLGRGIDPVGRQGWVAAIQVGARLEQVAAGILASTEYYNRGIVPGGPALRTEGRVGDLPVHAAEADAVAYLTDRIGTEPEVLDDTYGCDLGQIPGRTLAWDGLVVFVLTVDDAGATVPAHVAGWSLLGPANATTARMSTPEGLRIGDPEGRILELYTAAYGEEWLDPSLWSWSTGDDNFFGVVTHDDGTGAVVQAIGSGFFCGE